MQVDLHQHLWPEPFVAALHRRRSPPLLRGAGRHPRLEMRHEPACTIDLDAHDPGRRADALDRLGDTEPINEVLHIALLKDQSVRIDRYDLPSSK